MTELLVQTRQLAAPAAAISLATFSCPSAVRASHWYSSGLSTTPKWEHVESASLNPILARPSIRFGRVIKPGPDSAGFSVDVVHMDDVVGPHHRHPNGEVDMVMPLTPGAQFDGHGAGWVVYPPDSAHPPTVSGGAALVLYLLPDGAIEFSK